jgi:hypothetical protein
MEKMYDSVPVKLFYRIKHKLFNIFNDLKYKFVLKLKYGFDIRESWSLGHYACKYMQPRLNYLIDNYGYGVPGIFFDEDSIKNLKLERYFPEATISDVDYEPMEVAWKNVLKQIKFSIDYEADDISEPYDETIQKEVDEGFRLLGIFMQNLWD